MSADADILAKLDASPVLVVVAEGKTGGINSVYRSRPAVDTAAKTIVVPLPYLVYSGSVGYDRDERYSGDVGGKVQGFRLTGVGQSEDQAKWILNEAYKVLNRKRLGRALIKSTQDDQPVRPDDDFTRPGGAQIYYGVQSYKVAV